MPNKYIHYIPGVVAQIVEDGKVVEQKFAECGDDYFMQDGRMVNWDNQLPPTSTFPIQLIQPDQL